MVLTELRPQSWMRATCTVSRCSDRCRGASTREGTNYRTAAQHTLILPWGQSSISLPRPPTLDLRPGTIVASSSSSPSQEVGGGASGEHLGHQCPINTSNQSISLPFSTKELNETLDGKQGSLDNADHMQRYGTQFEASVWWKRLFKWAVKVARGLHSNLTLLAKAPAHENVTLSEEVVCRAGKMIDLSRLTLIREEMEKQIAVLTLCRDGMSFAQVTWSEDSTPPPASVPNSSDGCFVLFQCGEEHHGLVTLSRVPTSGSNINLPQQLCPCTCPSLCKGDGKSFLVIIFPPTPPPPLGICSSRLSHLTCTLTLRLNCSSGCALSSS
ncbi:hypothetical protein Q8A73_012863 [Channa argus]|nr:hypothetical protein Q8A73_012863 [Channa argus]